MEYQKITSFLDATSDNVPRLITKKWIELHDQSMIDTNQPNK